MEAFARGITKKLPSSFLIYVRWNSSHDRFSIFSDACSNISHNWNIWNSMASPRLRTMDFSTCIIWKNYTWAKPFAVWTLTHFSTCPRDYFCWTRASIFIWTTTHIFVSSSNFLRRQHWKVLFNFHCPWIRARARFVTCFDISINLWCSWRRIAIPMPVCTFSVKKNACVISSNAYCNARSYLTKAWRSTENITMSLTSTINNEVNIINDGPFSIVIESISFRFFQQSSWAFALFSLSFDNKNIIRVVPIGTWIVYYNVDQWPMMIRSLSIWFIIEPMQMMILFHHRFPSRPKSKNYYSSCESPLSLLLLSLSLSLDHSMKSSSGRIFAVFFVVVMNKSSVQSISRSVRGRSIE